MPSRFKPHQNADVHACNVIDSEQVGHKQGAVGTHAHKHTHSHTHFEIFHGFNVPVFFKLQNSTKANDGTPDKHESEVEP